MNATQPGLVETFWLKKCTFSNMFSLSVSSHKRLDTGSKTQYRTLRTVPYTHICEFCYISRMSWNLGYQLKFSAISAHIHVLTISLKRVIAQVTVKILTMQFHSLDVLAFLFFFFFQKSIFLALINRGDWDCMGESWPRWWVQTERSEVCTHERGQDSPKQTD